MRCIREIRIRITKPAYTCHALDPGPNPVVLVLINVACMVTSRRLLAHRPDWVHGGRVFDRKRAVGCHVFAMVQWRMARWEGGRGQRLWCLCVTLSESGLVQGFDSTRIVRGVHH